MRDVYIECPNLEVGNYYLFAEVDFPEDKKERIVPKWFTITSYGVDSLVFHEDQILTKMAILNLAGKALAKKSFSD